VERSLIERVIEQYISQLSVPIPYPTLIARRRLTIEARKANHEWSNAIKGRTMREYISGQVHVLGRGIDIKEDIEAGPDVTDGRDTARSIGWGLSAQYPGCMAIVALCRDDGYPDENDLVWVWISFGPDKATEFTGSDAAIGETNEHVRAIIADLGREDGTSELASEMLRAARSPDPGFEVETTSRMS
jgi:hypothetical protein